jgi:hypothetical protein
MLKNTRTRREMKRAEAEARQAAYDRLTLYQKLERTEEGSKQYKKLELQIDEWLAKKAASGQS